MLIVQKFGGSSLADFDRMRRVAQIILDARHREQQVLAVVSAAGDTTDELSMNAQRISASPEPRELDALLSTGEQQSAAYLAMLLRSLGAEAVSLTGWQAGILTGSTFGNAEIKKIFPKKIKAALSKGQIIIVSGFQGVTSHGDISTLGRGGSDTSAVALASALAADECRIYTDVNGIYTADPRLIPNAEFIDKIDYRDMLSLARSGSQVLKAESVKLAMDDSVKLRLLSSFEHSKGSLLCMLPDEERPDFAGVTRDTQTSTVSAVGKKASPETLSLLLDALRNAGFSVSSGCVNDNCISLKVAREQLVDAMELTHSFLIK